MLYMAWRKGLFSLITSQAQLEEIERVLSYKKLSRYIKKQEATSLINTLDTLAEIVIDIPEVDVSPDPDDNKIIATAIAGEADYLISGDKTDLLSLKMVQNIPILSPRQAIEQLNIVEN